MITLLHYKQLYTSRPLSISVDNKDYHPHSPYLIHIVLYDFYLSTNLAIKLCFLVDTLHPSTFFSRSPLVRSSSDINATKHIFHKKKIVSTKAILIFIDIRISHIHTRHILYYSQL